jgi:hypothetical protein
MIFKFRFGSARFRFRNLQRQGSFHLHNGGVVRVSRMFKVLRAIRGVLGLGSFVTRRLCPRHQVDAMRPAILREDRACWVHDLYLTLPCRTQPNQLNGG